MADLRTLQPHVRLDSTPATRALLFSPLLSLLLSLLSTPCAICPPTRHHRLVGYRSPVSSLSVFDSGRLVFASAPATTSVLSVLVNNMELIILADLFPFSLSVHLVSWWSRAHRPAFLVPHRRLSSSRSRGPCRLVRLSLHHLSSAPSFFGLRRPACPSLSEAASRAILPSRLVPRPLSPGAISSCVTSEAFWSGGFSLDGSGHMVYY